MVFGDIFNNSSVISLRSVLLMGETGVPGKNHRPATSHGHRDNWVDKTMSKVNNFKIRLCKIDNFEK